MTRRTFRSASSTATRAASPRCPGTGCGRLNDLLSYHDATSHSPASVAASAHALDWANQPRPFKRYTSLVPLALPLDFRASACLALDAIGGACDVPAQMALDRGLLARLCYFANGVTRVLQRPGGSMPFRAAACTGALYHIELYLICSPLAALAAGVYHYGAHDNALRQLRSGDFRRVVLEAAGGEPGLARAPVVAALTTTYWRNAWKYRERAYRHAFWDTGTILANLLAVASANGVRAGVIEGFADDEINGLLGIDPSTEACISLVALGEGGPEAPPAPPVPPLDLPTEALSPASVAYPTIVAAHKETSLPTGAAVAAWRPEPRPTDTPAPTGVQLVSPAPASDGRASIEAVILRRGSARRFSRAPIDRAALDRMLEVAARPIPSDVASLDALTDLYLIVNAVDGLAPGAYVFDRRRQSLDLLVAGEFRGRAAFLALDQGLAGDAAVSVYWLTDLPAVHARLGARGYRAAQLEAAVQGGRLYLAAYALGLAATGLTFFDDDVTSFFSPHAAGKSVMFLTAVGHPGRRAA